MAQDKLSLLNDLYYHEGYKHLTEWIDSQISKSMEVLKKPETPIEEVERARMIIHAYESLLDKVNQDKLAYTSREK